jgi:hypothetical protein
LILTALVIFCCTVSPDISRNPAPTAAAERRAESSLSSAEDVNTNKPDAPAPKAASSSNDANVSRPATKTVAPPVEPFSSTPIKPANPEFYETHRQRMIWYGLVAAGHSGAAFDAWTTRRAVTSGYGVESNPLERPFANSGAIYATTQICPALMDYLGHRMVRSGHPWMRRLWWVPQAASASFSIGAAAHNYTVVP